LDNPEYFLDHPEKFWELSNIIKKKLDTSGKRLNHLIFYNFFYKKK